MRDTSGISSKLGRAIRTLLKVRRETEWPFLLATVIWGFLSIFKRVKDRHEMKDVPAFKPLQANLALFRVMASPYPFHVRQQTQGPSHIPIAEGSLLLWCLWQVGIPLQSKPENQLSSRGDGGCTELSSSCSAEIGVPLDLKRLSQRISGCA